MPTEVSRPSVPVVRPACIQQAVLPGGNTPDTKSLGLTPLAIAAVLALVLHIASSVMLDHSPAAGTAFDGGVTCSAEVSPPQPSLPYD